MRGTCRCIVANHIARRKGLGSLEVPGRPDVGPFSQKHTRCSQTWRATCSGSSQAVSLERPKQPIWFRQRARRVTKRSSESPAFGTSVCLSLSPFIHLFHPPSAVLMASARSPPMSFRNPLFGGTVPTKSLISLLQYLSRRKRHWYWYGHFGPSPVLLNLRNRILSNIFPACGRTAMQ